MVRTDLAHPQSVGARRLSAFFSLIIATQVVRKCVIMASPLSLERFSETRTRGNAENAAAKDNQRCRLQPCRKHCHTHAGPWRCRAQVIRKQHEHAGVTNDAAIRRRNEILSASVTTLDGHACKLLLLAS